MTEKPELVIQPPSDSNGKSPGVTRRSFLQSLAAAGSTLVVPGFRFETPPLKAEKLKAVGLEDWQDVYSLSKYFTNKYGATPFAKIAGILHEVVDGKKAAESDEVLALKAGWYEGDESSRKAKAVKEAHSHLAGLNYEGADQDKMKVFLGEIADIYPLQALSCPPTVQIMPDNAGSILFGQWAKLPSPVTIGRKAALVADFHELTHGFQSIFDELEPVSLLRIKKVMTQKDAVSYLSAELSVMREAMEIWLRSSWEMASIMKYGNPLFQSADLSPDITIADLERSFPPPDTLVYRPRQDRAGDSGYRISRIIHYAANHADQFRQNPLFQSLMQNSIGELQHFFVGPPQGRTVGSWPKAPGDLPSGVLTELNVILHQEVTDATSTLPQGATMMEIAEALKVTGPPEVETGALLQGETQETYRLLSQYGAVPFGKGERYKFREEGEYNVFTLPDNKADPGRQYLYILFTEPLRIRIPLGKDSVSDRQRGLIISIPKDRFASNLSENHHNSEFVTSSDGSTHFRFQISTDQFVELTIPAQVGQVSPSNNWHTENDIAVAPIVTALKEERTFRLAKAPVIYRGGIGELKKSSGSVLWYITPEGRIVEFPVPTERKGIYGTPDNIPGLLATAPATNGRGFSILRENNQNELLLEGTIPDLATQYSGYSTLGVTDEKDTYIFANPEDMLKIPFKISLTFDDETRKALDKFLTAKASNSGYNSMMLGSHYSGGIISYDLVIKPTDSDVITIIPVKKIDWG